jgi:hypothetical protein
MWSSSGQVKENWFILWREAFAVVRPLVGHCPFPTEVLSVGICPQNPARNIDITIATSVVVSTSILTQTLMTELRPRE